MNYNVVNKQASTHRESLTELLGQLASNSAAMVHDEIELVIQGIREKVRSLRSGVLIVATGAVIIFAAIMSLCAALFIELASYMAPVIAALVAGAVLALIGIVIAFIGYKQLKKSIDYTPTHLPHGQSNAVLLSFMAHHQGMSFLSLACLLLDRPMQKRFASDPMFQATVLLLQERLPKATAFYSATLSEVHKASHPLEEKPIHKSTGDWQPPFSTPIPRFAPVPASF